MPRKNRQTTKRLPRGRRIIAKLITLTIIVLVALGGLAYNRLVPALYPVNDLKLAETTAANLSWPSDGAAAVGAVGYGVLATHGPQIPKPTASVAKLITGLAVLQKYPLTPGQAGPTITLTQADVDIFNKYYAENGSLAAVQAGEQISEYQMMEAMLLPSANNMADSLATWAFGSLPAYSAFANTFVKSIGLQSTTIGSDASGFLPDTLSTPHDLVLLGVVALSNPVISQIVQEKQATIPVAGVIYNVNFLLGTDGISGIKTGNTDQAGGVYVFSTDYSAAPNHNVKIVGAVQGTPTLQRALDDAVPLLSSAEANFKLTTVIKNGQIVGQYNLPWSGASVNAVAAQDVKSVIWLGDTSPKPLLNLRAVHAPAATGSSVGTINLAPPSTSSSTKVILQHALPKPPISWRLFHHYIF